MDYELGIKLDQIEGKIDYLLNALLKKREEKKVEEKKEPTTNIDLTEGIEL